MIIAVAELIPKKLLKKGISVPMYEGHFEDDKLQLTLRETRHLEGAYIPRAMVTFLNMVAALPPEQQLLMLRLTMDVMNGRACKHIELDGEPFVYFPDPYGDNRRDQYISFNSVGDGEQAGPKAKPKARAKSAKNDGKKKR
jgi:hypothetical protein